MINIYNSDWIKNKVQPEKENAGRTGVPENLQGQLPRFFLNFRGCALSPGYDF